MIRIYLFFLSFFFFLGCGEKDNSHDHGHGEGDLSTDVNKSQQTKDKNKNATLPRINLDDADVRRKIIEQAVEVASEEKADGTIVFYEPLASSPYKGTGWVVMYYDDGSLLNLSQLKDGKKDGLYTFWHENGQMKEEASWKDGNLDGYKGLARKW